MPRAEEDKPHGVQNVLQHTLQASFFAAATPRTPLDVALGQKVLAYLEAIYDFTEKSV
jgi:hypothetical protein